MISAANPAAIKAVVAQQFELGKTVLSHGLVPIIEPEVTITIADKAEAEAILRDEILALLDTIPAGEQVMLKLTLPAVDGFYQELVAHPARIELHRCLASPSSSHRRGRSLCCATSFVRTNALSCTF